MRQIKNVLPRMIEVDMEKFMGDWVRGRLAGWCMMRSEFGSEDGTRMYAWVCRDGLNNSLFSRESSFNSNPNFSWLYALKNEKYSYTKIGRSTKPWQRLHQLRKTWGQDCEFVTLPVWEEIIPETEVHHLLRDHRVSQLGAGRRDGDTEWFDRYETVLAFETALDHLVNGGL